ncbi:MAG: GntR family transcriptional regulator [Thermoguttaceae bacterium]|jgi:LacI family transcriptional regulator
MEAQPLDRRKHRKIYEHIHGAIARGVYVPGDRLPTDLQLMREFCVSRPTVARAMRELEIAGLLERCPGTGTFVRRVDAPQTMPLGLLIPRLNKMGIFGPICDEIARATQSHGFHLLWANLGQGDCEEAMQQFCRQCVQQKMAGVFFAPLELEPEMEEINRRTAETLDRAGIAVVLLDRDVQAFPSRSPFDMVGVDNFRVGCMQTEYLLRLGYRHIEHLARPFSAPTVEARTEGYRRAFRFHAASYKESWVRRGDPADLEFVKGITRKLPDAIVSANDWTAATFMRSLQSLGIRVPQDVRVIGVDDDDYAHMVSPPLTTIRQPSREIGAAAVRAMVERIEDRKMPPRDILLGCTLVVRESCGEVL